MKKLFISLLACLCVGLSAIGVAACSDDGDVMDFKFLLNEDEQSYTVYYFVETDIEEYNSPEAVVAAHPEITSITTLNIPESYNGLPVTAIGDYGFMCFGMEMVNIPDSVESIGESAFEDCDSLTSVEIGDSVQSIGEYAFYYCTSLTSVEIGDSVQSIGDDAFYSCDSLTSVEIGDSVQSIGDHAFYNCYKLVEVYNKSALNITAGSSGYGYVGCYAKNVYTQSSGESKLSTDENGYIIYTDGEDKILVGYKGSETDLVLPEGITAINQYAFYNCFRLTSVEIGDSVQSIGDHAFAGCSSLTSVEIGDSVQSIGYDAFRNCFRLTSVEIGDSVQSIGEDAFRYCDKLVEVYNKSALNITAGSSDYGYVGYYAKNVYTQSSGESKLSTDENGYLIYTDGEDKILVGYKGRETDLVLPEGITAINQYAFYGCSLTSVEIGDSVQSIGYRAFSWCTSLTSVVIPDSVQSIGDYAFKDCTSLTSVEIGDSVQSIGGSAFSGCSRITSITIPDSVQSIGEYAFAWCDSLTSVVIGDSVQSIGDYAFRGCDSLTEVYYKGTASEWSAITIGSSNSDLTDATRYYYSEEQPTGIGNYWHYVDGVVTKW